MHIVQQFSKRHLLIGGGIVVGLLLAVTGFLAFKYVTLEKDPGAATKATTDKIIARVDTLIELPTDETPTIAQVQDKAKLKDQPFFDKAQNGDYVLIYSKNKQALIYRPSVNKLINVGPISFKDDLQQH